MFLVFLVTRCVVFMCSLVVGLLVIFLLELVCVFCWRCQDLLRLCISGFMPFSGFVCKFLAKFLAEYVFYSRIVYISFFDYLLDLCVVLIGVSFFFSRSTDMLPFLFFTLLRYVVSMFAFIARYDCFYFFYSYCGILVY